MVCTMRRVRGRSGPILALLTCLVVLAGLAACSSPSPATSPAPTGSAGPAASGAAGATGAQPGSTAAPQAGPQAAPAPSTPADAALRLQALLGQHHILAADMMRGRLRNDEDFAQAANAAVGQNTDELAQVVAILGGEQRATQFQTLWGAHVTSLFNYSRGLATNDAAVRDEARVALDRFRTDGAEFVAEASQGRLTREAVRTELGTHDDHLMQQADAYAAGDYAQANTLYREGYQHAYALGNTLAVNVLPPEQAAELSTPAWKLRSEMTRLLGEHVGLALGTLRAGATNAPDFPAMAESLNGNTSDVTAAVSSLFGEPAATQFMELWADHLDLLGGYAADVGAQKENRREEVQAGLRDWQARFASFIETATGGRVPAPDLAAALLGLDDLLLGQVDALRGHGLPAGARAGQPDLPAGVRVRAQPGRRVRGDARGRDAPGRRADRRRRDGGRAGAAGRRVPACGARRPGRRAGALPVGPHLRGGGAAGPAADPGPEDRHPAAAAGPGPPTGRSRCPPTSGSPAGSPAGRDPASPARR